MTWEARRETIRQLIQRLAELPTVWEDQPRPFVDPGLRAIVLLTTFGMMTKGKDEKIPVVDLNQPAGQELQENVRGVRLFTIQIKVESYEQTDDRNAGVYASRVRDRLSRSSSKAALRSVQTSFVRVGEVRDLSDLRDERRTSVAVLDLRLSLQSQELDPFRFSSIETVEIREAYQGNLAGSQYVHTQTRTGIIQ
jgi:hypothetical protein